MLRNELEPAEECVERCAVAICPLPLASYCLLPLAAAVCLLALGAMPLITEVSHVGHYEMQHDEEKANKMINILVMHE